MRNTVRTTALVIALLTPAAGWRVPGEQLSLQPQSKLWIEGTSTVRGFSCKAGVVNALVDTRGTGAVTQILGGDKAVLAMDLKVPAEKLDCGNGTMNEHMLKALKADENPTILFRLVSYDIARGQGAATGTLRGVLTLGGVQKPMTIVAEGKPEGDQLRVTGQAEVKMTDFDLKPPTLMFGRIKVNENVMVKFDLLLKS
jgi:polyisoprenoid-binding protein YceI